MPEAPGALRRVASPIGRDVLSHQGEIPAPVLCHLAEPEQRPQPGSINTISSNKREVADPRMRLLVNFLSTELLQISENK
jgi:hypothetical protein